MARVSLARALFAANADLYLLDNIFASLDVKVTR